MRRISFRKKFAAGVIAAMTLGGVAVMALPAASSAAATIAATRTTLTSARPVATYTPSGALVARVVSSPTSAGVPTGSVDFAIDGGYFETVALDATGRARMPLTDVFPSYYPGTYSVTATYSGDAGHSVSASAAVDQKFVGITAAPVTTLTSNAKGLPVFSVRSFTMQSLNPVGCNILVTNNTASTVALAYGTPGAWKRLPFGGLAPGATTSLGVGFAPYTGYFTTTANTANYVAVHCR